MVVSWSTLPAQRGAIPHTTTTTTTNPKAASRRPLPRAAKFVPPLLLHKPRTVREHVKVVPPSKERVARVIKQAQHKRLKQVRGADRQLASAIRTHYRERLEKGKARVMAKACAAWQQEMKERVGMLSTRLLKTVLSIGAGHRQAEEEVKEREQHAAAAAQQAERRRDEESVRFSRAQEKARVGGQQRVNMSLSSSQARQREERRKEFMLESRTLTQRKKEDGRSKSSSSSSSSHLPRIGMSASVGAARTSPFLVRGTGRGGGATSAGRQFGAVRGKGKVEDDLLETLASLDRSRKIQKRRIISSSIALRPSQEGRGGGGGGRGENGREGEEQAEEAVEAVLLGQIPLAPARAPKSRVSVPAAAVGPGPRPRPAMRQVPSQQAPLEEQEEEEGEVQGGRARAGARTGLGVTGTRWQDMEEMVARIERLQKEMGEGGVEEDEDEEDEEEEDEEEGEEVEEGSSSFSLLGRGRPLRFERQEEDEQEEEEDDGGEVEGEEAETGFFSATSSTAELEREIEDMRKSLEEVARSLRGRSFDPKLDALMEQRRQLQKAMNLSRGLQKTGSSASTSRGGSESSGAGSTAAAAAAGGGGGDRGAGRGKDGLNAASAPFVRRAESSRMRTQPMTFRPGGGGLDELSSDEDEEEKENGADKEGVGASTRLLHGRRGQSSAGPGVGFNEREVMEEGKEAMGKQPTFYSDSESETSVDMGQPRPLGREGGEEEEKEEEESFYLEEQYLEEEEEGEQEEEDEEGARVEMSVDRIVQGYQQRRRELVSRLESRRRQDQGLASFPQSAPSDFLPPSASDVTPAAGSRAERTRLLQLLRQREARGGRAGGSRI